ncbi:low molecular weight protein-tyrosine-phosphatase [uncultured Tessaracoccus sp.]|uniref:low molecular weight protein-tyrosine-phosphatase n=1 Tax=uncultured Tessaracoccus sp. TaxID=905023 RepID=UPI0025EAC4B9|nr:low molecular weight protein-tyrosine-phosphatase [uncultured Tessaracoccus sp.]
MHVMFLCHGNICRSPMAERVARRMAADRGLDLTISSTGVSDEEAGRPMDRRARRVLADHGYDAEGHVARMVTPELARDVDRFVVAEQHHADELRALGVDPAAIHLVTDFDPEAAPGDPLPDPWYGGPADFERTLDVLERAVPRLLDELA